MLVLDTRWAFEVSFLLILLVPFAMRSQGSLLQISQGMNRNDLKSSIFNALDQAVKW